MLYWNTLLRKMPQSLWHCKLNTTLFLQQKSVANCSTLPTHSARNVRNDEKCEVFKWRLVSRVTIITYIYMYTQREIYTLPVCIDFLSISSPIQHQQQQRRVKNRNLLQLHVWNGKFLWEFRGRCVFVMLWPCPVTNSVEMLHLLRLLK